MSRDKARDDRMYQLAVQRKGLRKTKKLSTDEKLKTRIMWAITRGIDEYERTCNTTVIPQAFLRNPILKEVMKVITKRSKTTSKL